MSERFQEKTSEEERVTAKSRPMMTLVSKTVEKSSTALRLSASKRPETLRAQGQNLVLIACAGGFAAIDSNEDVATSSQARYSEVNPSSSMKRPVATENTHTISRYPEPFSSPTPRENRLEPATENWSYASELNARHLREFVDMEIVSVRHDGRNCLSQSALPRNFRFHQNTTGKRIKQARRKLWDIYD